MRSPKAPDKSRKISFGRTGVIDDAADMKKSQRQKPPIKTRAQEAAKGATAKKRFKSK